MDDDHKYPTFNALRLKHHISLEELSAEELSAAAGPSLSMEEIQLFDETGRADPYTADDLLFLLSELSGQRYTRGNVGGITLVLARPPMSPTQPQPLTGLRERPTLLELFVAYKLDLDWLAEALMIEESDVWQLIVGRIVPQRIPRIEALLQLLSRYIGIPYTLETITLGQCVHIAQPCVSSSSR